MQRCSLDCYVLDFNAVLYRGLDVGNISHRKCVLFLRLGATLCYILLLTLPILTLVPYCNFFYLFVS